ncbi:hypothetical protein [Nodosilinea sp. E11]|uniref:hypothetical protein n=1 Tax=Nodosilinea sp. E11 TaxID=3037479 RepID=UPI002934633A|nr:hypothetical protein [Nodosilinea sp. E11]WOD37494.1 hypothetical protein RRF56_14895 [Nodosilinea sp. E11]
MDLQSIQTKLIQTVNTLNQSNGEVQVDWVGGPHLPISLPQPEARTRPGVDFAAAVDALQWRAVEQSSAVNGLSQSGAVPSGVPSEVFLKRLRAIVDKINTLSAEQARAIAEMQSIQARLTQGQPMVPPILDLSQAMIAVAEEDGQGNILLSCRTVSPQRASQPESSRGHSAQVIPPTRRRSAQGRPARRSRGRGGLSHDVLALGQEPLQLLSRLGRLAWSLVQGFTGVATAANSGRASGQTIDPSSGAPSLSVTDGVIWLGGGVIGRLALNVMLAAFPPFWSVAVAAITAITAYALYRATLAPKLAFGPALRVFLLVVGLVVGGQI